MITIVLDPGHGGTEPGARAFGLWEKDLNLKIAQFTKEELETYDGVTIGITRNSDTTVGISQRAEIAKGLSANILVSMHLNADTEINVGAKVYVSSLEPYKSNSAILGNMILNNLVSLGLCSRGVKTKKSKTTPGKDYYGIIRYSVERGFPGIIIEHCFIDNPEEAKEYLSSDDKLRELALADATALAKYYGLKKKTIPLTEPITTTVCIIPPTVQYSGVFSISATFHGTTNLDGKIISFELNGKVLGTSIFDFTAKSRLTNIPMKVELTNVVAEEKAGTYPVTIYLLDGISKTALGSSALTVTSKNALISYNGDICGKKKQPVRLTCTVTQDGDGSSGDLSLARINVEIYTVRKRSKQLYISFTLNCREDGIAETTTKFPSGNYYILTSIIDDGYYKQTNILPEVGFFIT